MAILAYLLFALDLGLAPHINVGPMSPRLVLPLAVYVAMYAPARAALWLGLCLGLVTDLLTPIAMRGPGGVNAGEVLWPVGPHAVGYMAGIYAVIVLRGYMIKRSPGTPPALTLVAAIVATVVSVAMMSVRHQLHVTVRLVEPSAWPWSAGAELLARSGSAVYTAIVAFPLAMALRPLTRVMGLDDAPHRRR